MERNNSFLIIIMTSLLVLVANSSCSNKLGDKNGEVDNIKYDTTFYPNGNLYIIKILNAENKLNGEKKVFYPNGTINYIESYKNGKLFGNNYYYFPSGKMMMYSAYGFNNNLFFHLQSDSSGVIKFLRGKIFDSTYEIEGGKNKIRKNKLYKINVLFVQPKFYVFHLDSVTIFNGSKERKFSTFTVNREKSFVSIKYSSNKEGIYYLKLFGSLFLKDKVEFKDQLCIKLSVI